MDKTITLTSEEQALVHLLVTKRVETLPERYGADKYQNEIREILESILNKLKQPG